MMNIQKWLTYGTSVLIIVIGGTAIYEIENKTHAQVLSGSSTIVQVPHDSTTSAGDLKQIIQQDQKAVVQINVTDGNLQMIGSGFLYDNKGDIITNGHVVGNASKVTVKLDDSSTYQGTVIGKSSDVDVALIRCAELATRSALTAANDRKVEIGDEVIAFGSPLGLSGTVTTGIVSGMGRDFTLDPYHYKNMLQISAPIAPGNSGGPLVLKKTGEVIGVNTAGANQGDIGFSIPMSQVLSLVDNWTQNPVSAANTATEALSGTNSPAPSAGRSSPAQMQTDAKNLLSYFYQLLNSKDYVTAYSLLGSDWKNQTSYDQFRNGYLNTVNVSIQLNQADAPANGVVQVHLVIEARETVNGQPQISTYKTDYKVGYENNKLRLVQGTAEKQ